MASNAFSTSIKIVPVRTPFSNPVVTLSVRYPKQVFTESFFWKPDWNLHKSLFLLKTPVLEPFLKCGLILAILQLLGKELSLIERL